MRRLEVVQTDILGYKFREPRLLLTALTHKSGQAQYRQKNNYEKLELLGDAVLDYLVNSNLLSFTLFERYLEKSDVYRGAEDFNCADAHQAKCRLVNNEMLAKFTVIMGLHKYIVFYNATDNDISTKDVDDYLNFSFRSDFKLNQREIEPFEAPKILGDVFESVMGAVF